MDLLAIALGLGSTVVVLFLICALTFPWIVFGLNLMISKLTTRGNTGIILIRGQNNNFGIPIVVNLSKKLNNKKIGGVAKEFPTVRDAFVKSTTMFGVPMMIINGENAGQTLGLHTRKPVYETHTDDKTGEEVRVLKGFTMDEEMSQSNLISPELIDALIKEKALTNAFKSLMNQNMIVLYAAIAAVIAAGASAYFGYEIISNHFPNAMTMITAATTEINTKLDLILAAVNK
jgi:hypothetical protein